MVVQSIGVLYSMLFLPKIHALYRTLLVIIVVLLQVSLLDVLPLALEVGQYLALCWFIIRRTYTSVDHVPSSVRKCFKSAAKLLDTGFVDEC